MLPAPVLEQALPYHLNPRSEIRGPLHGVWGLKERDTNLSAEEQEAVVETLLRVLRARERELHVSEVAGALADAGVVIPSNVSPYVLCSLAQGDDRFRWNRGQLLGLREWGAARRMSVSRAVREVVEELRGPASFDEIWKRVCERVDRTVPKMQLSSHLQVAKLRFDEATSLWCPSAGEEPSSSEEFRGPDDSMLVVVVGEDSSAEIPQESSEEGPP